MKLLINLTIVFLLFGCSYFQNPQIQPVESLGKNKFITSCGGAFEDWGSCRRKAQLTCVNGYDVTEKLEGSSGVHRSFSFSCL
jgi:hypothetical protein